MNNLSHVLIIILISLLPAQVFAAQYQDIIYKTDGSILKGTIIEQNFQLERYKIELQGGSIFVVEQKDISKITKEPVVPFSSTPTAEPTFSEPVPVKSTASNIAPLQSHSVQNNYQGPIQATDSVFIGAFSHTRSKPLYPEYYYSSYSIEEKFRGAQFGFHQTLTKNLAMVYTIEKAKLREIIIRDENSNEDLYEIPLTEDIDYLGKKVSLILSTNQHKNWRFFIGGGIYHNDYKGEYSSDKLYGTRLDLGMGYSWKQWQLSLRAAGDITNNEDDIDYSLFDFSLAVGINF